MHTTRRDFLRYSTAAASLTVLGLPGRRLRAQTTQSTTQPTPKAAQALKILILGGTSFLGPATVEAAQARGHTLTLFNRGKTNPGIFPDVEQLHGDRDPNKGEGLKALADRKWDAVVDTSAYVPRITRASCELLKDAVKHYVFISTISVYGNLSQPDMDETAPVSKIDDESEEKISGESYGPLKALCEQTAERILPGRVATIRPGLIVGPRDPSDRFTYWPVRVARGGEVLAPGDPADPISVIDVRDLAEWTVHTIENGIVGVFNATGPKEKLTIGQLLESCKKVSGSDAKFTWAEADFLDEQKVEAWSDMPVWIPPRGEDGGMGYISRSKAIAKGLTFRPLDVTTKDTLEWFKTLPEERRGKLRAGIKPEREAEVLAAWRARKGK